MSGVRWFAQLDVRGALLGAVLALLLAPASAQGHRHHHRHHHRIGAAPTVHALHRAPAARPAVAAPAPLEGPVEYVDEEAASPREVLEWEAEQARLEEEGLIPPAEVVDEHPTTSQEEAEAGEGIQWESVG